MCEHGDVVWARVGPKPAAQIEDAGGSLVTFPPKPERYVRVDRCLARIVTALNDAGIVTTNSCCGHGRARGGIFLADGRMLVVTTVRDGLALTAEGDDDDAA